MQNQNGYDKYYDELTSFDTTFGNFRQITTDSSEMTTNNYSLCSDSSYYTPQQSLLFSVETDDFVEFCDGKPSLFVKYHAIIIVGSSKFQKNSLAICPIDDNFVDFNECNFYSDYFLHHPTNIKITNSCCDGGCEFDIHKKGLWCDKCFGNFNVASNLIYIMHENIKFSEMPMDSILYIEKFIWNADDSMDSLVKIKNFLDNDKRKIELLQTRIGITSRKMQLMVNTMQTEIKCNENKIINLLLTRGGSMEEYQNTIDQINEKIRKEK